MSPRENQGFASMDKEKLKEISSKAGKKAQESGNAHNWTVEEATINSKKGQEARRLKKLKKQNESND